MEADREFPRREEGSRRNGCVEAVHFVLGAKLDQTGRRLMVCPFSTSTDMLVRAATWLELLRLVGKFLYRSVASGLNGRMSYLERWTEM